MNPYKVLGVSVGVSKTELKSAYRKLARLYHPDNGGNREKYEEVCKAYDMLSNSKVTVPSIKKKHLHHVSLFNYEAVVQ